MAPQSALSLWVRGVHQSSAADRRDDGLTGVAMSKVSDAVVIADDLYMVEVVTVAERKELANRTGPERLHMPLPPPGRALPQQRENQCDQLADEDPGQQSARGCCQRLAQPGASVPHEHLTPGCVRAQERIVPIFKTQRSAGGFTHVRLFAAEARIIRAGACSFMEPLCLDSREQLRTFDETRSQSFWKQGKEGSAIVEKPARPRMPAQDMARPKDDDTRAGSTAAEPNVVLDGLDVGVVKMESKRADDTDKSRLCAAGECQDVIQLTPLVSRET